MKNLVMGVAKGYGWDILEPFVTSFEKNCPSAELILFVDDISDFTRARLQRVDRVCLVDIPAQYKEILIINSRWKMYTDFLEQYGANYAQIFLTDTRDVIFQADLFAPFKKFQNFFGYAIEPDDIRGSKSGEDINYQWLESYFGKDVAERFAKKKVICCGTVIGSVTELKIFCHIMWEMLRDDEIWGHEQAVMNYLVYENLLPIKNLIEIDVEHGEIFTNGLVSESKIRDDKILRGDDRVPAVVHQYDRKQEGIQLVDEVYRDKNFQIDSRFLDTRSAIEQVTSLLFANKIDAAEQLFINNFLVAEDFTNFLKPLIRFWEIAMRKPLSPTIERLELYSQLALKAIGEFPLQELKSICDLLKISREGRHYVDSELRDSLSSALLQKFEQTFSTNAVNERRLCKFLLKKLGVSSNQIAAYERTLR